MTENPQAPQQHTNPLFTHQPGPPPPQPASPPYPEPPRKRTSSGRVGVLATSAAVVAALVGGAGGAALVTATHDGTGTPTSTSAVGSATGQQVSTGSADVSGVAEKVLPSVVQIEAPVPGGQSLGSGVILSKDGRILTNAHVVSDAVGDVTVTLSDGTTYQASVLGSDEKADIAVLQAKGASGLTPATLGDSDSVKVGQEVVAIGSPAGLQNTVTSGIVSAVDRKLSDLSGQEPQSPFGQQAYDQTSASPSYTAIQTDASINHGNSGGPLVNSAGEVIGINSAMYSPSGSGSVGIGFAIPVNDAKTIIDNIENGA
ncbi:S1C family serine protease [Prauserella flavalba]|uniref:Serine protease n=1 Tax=Prauserella flavalba TaxID=1477506 RepID=A0A318LSC1_9PSEU|nr:trypsin-like peptidase domain-containing protein [Prauserella flavalba]PXY34073.1 serine protease [Prauserella flavalba]